MLACVTEWLQVCAPVLVCVFVLHTRIRELNFANIRELTKRKIVLLNRQCHTEQNSHMMVPIF
jgi:hypothetical protein